MPIKINITLHTIAVYFLVTVLTHATPQDTFTSYKSAILSQAGEKAANIVTSSTIEKYQIYVNAAKYGDKEALQKMSFLSRFQVLMMRHRIPTNILEDMDGKSAFVYTVDHDWIGKTGVIPMQITNVRESGTRAVSEAYLNGQKLPYEFTYKQEGGEWKFDLTQIIMNSEAPMRMAAAKANMKEDHFIFIMLETLSGVKPTETLWQPPFKK